MSDLNYVPATRKSDLIGVLTVIAVFFALVIFVSPAKALAGCVVAGTFLSIIQTKKKSQRDRRFWTIIAVLAVIHIVVLSLIHIPEPRFGLMSLPFALADGFAIWGLLNWIERRFPTERGGSLTKR